MEIMNRTYSVNGNAEVGQGVVEYALILVLIAVVVIGGLILLGPEVENYYSIVVNKFSGFN
jgi:pilus assembly protein Flp/PilA